MISGENLNFYFLGLLVTVALAFIMFLLVKKQREEDKK